MAKALGIVDQNDASRLQPIDGRARIGFTQSRRPAHQLPKESVTRFKLRKVPHPFIRRHDPVSRANDLHAANDREIRAVRRHRGRDTRIGLDFAGMLRIGLRYQDERQPVAGIKQVRGVRSAAETQGSELHHMVHRKKAPIAWPSPEVMPTDRFVSMPFVPTPTYPLSQPPISLSIVL